MKARVVCVHGIGQQLLGEQTLLSQWIPALQDGMSRAGCPSIATEDVSMAFYGDLFRLKGMKSLGIPPYDPSDISEGWEKEFLLTLWRDGLEPDLCVKEGEQMKFYVPRIVERALNALSQSPFFANVALNAFIADLKQVSAYLHDDELRHEVRSRVEAAITDETRIVVAHSLGTVVAYEALCANSRSVSTFVTLGSPLGINNLIFDRLRPANQNGLGVWPSSISSWTNIAAVGDVVALVKQLGTKFGSKVKDHLISNEAHAHDVVPYLTNCETGFALCHGI